MGRSAIVLWREGLYQFYRLFPPVHEKRTVHPQVTGARSRLHHWAIVGSPSTYIHNRESHSSKPWICPFITVSPKSQTRGRTISPRCSTNVILLEGNSGTRYLITSLREDFRIRLPKDSSRGERKRLRTKQRLRTSVVIVREPFVYAPESVRLTTLSP